jgi:4'-phosphopantetheinyl transferase EntD
MNISRLGPEASPYAFSSGLVDSDPMPHQGAADIYFGVMPLSGAPESADGAWLDGAERARLAAMSGPIRPREFLGGRFLAKSMAARILGVDPADIGIEVEAEGRPRIAAPEALCLGITHTRDYAACAISRSRVGLDFEELGRKGELKGVEDYAFSPREKAFAAGEDRELRFFAIWTLKEAYLKRLGLGVPEIRRAPSFELGPGAAISAAGGEECGYSCFALGQRIVGAMAYDVPAGVRKGWAPRVAIDPGFGPPPALEPRALYGDAILA